MRDLVPTFCGFAAGARAIARVGKALVGATDARVAEGRLSGGPVREAFGGKAIVVGARRDRDQAWAGGWLSPASRSRACGAL
jgi:hypothetical protein